MSKRRGDQQGQSGKRKPATVLRLMKAPKGPEGPRPDDALAEFSPRVKPIALEVSESLEAFVNPGADSGRFCNVLLPWMRQGLFETLGVVFPGVRVRADLNLSEGEYRIEVEEVPAATGKVMLGHVLVNATAEHLRLLKLTAIEAINPAANQPAAWVAEARAKVLESLNFTTWDVAGFLVLHLAAVLRRHAREFVGVQETQSMLEKLGKDFPALIKEVVPGIVSVLTLSEILARLAEEGVSIRNLRAILQALALYGEPCEDRVLLTEYVRVRLRRQISHKFAAGKNVVSAYFLGTDIEERIRGGITPSATGSQLVLGADLADRIIQAVKAVCDRSQLSSPPLIVTAPDIRPHVRRLLDFDFGPAVLSQQEIVATLRIEAIASISL